MYELFKDIINKTLTNELFPSSNISWKESHIKGLI